MRRCYVSYKTEDLPYAHKVLTLAPGSFIRPPDADACCYEDGLLPEDVREEILEGSEVTIHLIGRYSAELLGRGEQRFIKRELQASLCKAKNGLRSGVLGIVLPEASGAVYKGTCVCPECGRSHERIVIDDSTVVTEFSRNYRSGCNGERGYCALAQWEAFIADPDRYIKQACARRFGPEAQTVVP
jgi:hypothetical protein